MPTYNSITDRSATTALMPEEVTREIFQALPEASVVMNLARKLPDMSRGVLRMPVYSALPTAYFVTGDTGLKQTTQAAWANKYLTAEEVAVIVPISQAVLNDVDYNIWDEVKPHIVEAFGIVIDQAMLFGTNKPTSWPDDVVTMATGAGNIASMANYPDIYDATLAPGGSINLIEEDGYRPTGHVAPIRTKARLRGLRDAIGQPIFTRAINQDGQGSWELDGETIIFPENGAIDPSSTNVLLSGDWRQMVWSIRQDMTWDVTTEGVISDANGAIIYNLFQQDMAALRVVLRLGFQVPNPTNRLNTNSATRCPFSVLTT